MDKGVKENKQNKKESKRVDTGIKKNNRSKKELKGIVKTPFAGHNLYPPGSLPLVRGLITSVDLRQPSINLVFSGKVIIIRK